MKSKKFIILESGQISPQIVIAIVLILLIAWGATSYFAKSNIREVPIDLTWDTIAPSISNYERLNVEPSDVGSFIPEYATIEMTVGRIISINNIVKVVIYVPTQEIDLDTVVIVFVANQNPKEVTKSLSIASIEEWQYSAFTVKDIQNDEYGVVILSKDGAGVNKIEKAILRIE